MPFATFRRTLIRSLHRWIALSLLGVASAALPSCGDDDGGTAAHGAEDDSVRRRLERGTGVTWRVDVAADGTVYAEPDAPPRGMTASGFVDRFATDLGMLAGIERDTVRDLASGGKAYGFYQTHGGVHVEDGRIDVQTDASGSIELVLGRWIQALDRVPTTAAVAQRAAEDTAFGEAKQANPWLERTHVVGALESGLVVFSRGTEPVLAYRVAFDASTDAADPSQPYVALAYVIDATSGAILSRRSRIKEATPVDASGRGVRGFAFGGTDVKPFKATRDDARSIFTLVSPAADGVPEIQVHDASKRGAPVIESAFATQWDERPATDPYSAGNGSAVDAAHHFTLAARYWKDTHGWRSWDGKGAVVHAWIHLPRVDGSWSSFIDQESRQGFVFWDVFRNDAGTVVPYLPGSAGLDVVAHEFGHGIQARASVGMIAGTGEQGAIGEGMADVLGALVEHHYRPDDVRNWTFGEDVTRDGSALRDSNDPARTDNVAHVSKYRPHDAIHDNSTIISHAFRLMTLGGTNAVSGVHIPPASGIGWANLEKLVFATVKAQRPETGFGELAWRTIRIARRELSIPVAPVTCSWVAVGVLSNESAKREHGVDCSCLAPDARAVPANDPSLACCTPASAACCRKCDDSILGHWQGDWGKISFAEIDGELRAVYTYREGTVLAKGAPGTYEGCWSEKPTRDRYDGLGPAEWKVLGSESRIDGRWQHVGRPTWKENWDVSWVSPVIPADHLRRLRAGADFATCR